MRPAMRYGLAPWKEEEPVKEAQMVTQRVQVFEVLGNGAKGDPYEGKLGEPYDHDSETLEGTLTFAAEEYCARNKVTRSEVGTLRFVIWYADRRVMSPVYKVKAPPGDWVIV